VQNGSEAHLVSYTVCAVDYFLGVKRGWGVTLTTHHYSAEVNYE
jgi:hypothetical protein